MNELVLTLAMACVAEISLQPETTECELMWEINQRNAERRGNVSLLEQTRQFNAYFDPRVTDRRTWIGELNMEGTQPPSWFGGARSWKRHRPLWMKYLRAAARFAKNPRTALCPDADDYGGKPYDGKYADDDPPKDCYRRIQCLDGETFQAYWDTDECRRRT